MGSDASVARAGEEEVVESATRENSFSSGILGRWRGGEGRSQPTVEDGLGSRMSVTRLSKIIT